MCSLYAPTEQFRAPDRKAKSVLVNKLNNYKKPQCLHYGLPRTTICRKMFPNCKIRLCVISLLPVNTCYSIVNQTIVWLTYMSTNKLDQLTIADKASELFIRRGYTNTSLSEIGQACGILKGSIYHHFENKDHLLLFILERLRSDLNGHVFSIADNKDQSPADRLRNINAFLKDYFLEKKACLIAMMGMETELISEDARKILHEIFKDWKQAYVKLFKYYHTPYMAEMHATNSIVYIEGAIVWMRITQENLPLKRAFKTIEKNLRAIEHGNLM